VSVTVTPIKPEIGVEVTGVSGSAFVDPEVAKECEAALDAHGVVVYRDANIDDDDLIAFSHMLGPVHIWPNNDEQKRELGIVSLDPTIAKNAAVQRGTFNWHIDGTMADYPHRITLLSCIEPPNDGSGDTEFANTYAAYDALTDDEKAEIDDLQVHYSYLNRAHLEQPHVTEQTVAAYEKYPPRDRPLVWTHRTGRKSMLLGSTASEVIGWQAERGEALLERLLDWSTQPRFTLRHHWSRGDLVVWDNTGVLHRAHPYEPESGRLMHRTTIDGDETVA
jgi:alpha-ketoglutarate-dependent taurine dioxygenase